MAVQFHREEMIMEFHVIVVVSFLDCEMVVRRRHNSVQRVGGGLVVDRNRYGVYDDGRTVFGQHVVHHGRDNISVHRQRDVIRSVRVEREYRHFLSVFVAVRGLLPATFLVRRVIIGQVHTAVLRAEPLFDVRFELVHGPVRRIGVGHVRHTAPVRQILYKHKIR